MKIIVTNILAVSLLLSANTEQAAVASSVNRFNLRDTRLIDTNQNQAYETKSQVALEIEQPVIDFFQIASVNFITGNKQLNFGNVEFDDPTVKLCLDAGYNRTSCNSGYWASDFCSENPQYFKTCCDNKYKYTPSQCQYPMTRSGDSCGGKYMCYCDRSLYAYSSCPSPKVVTSSSCTENGVTYYSSCVCPSYYNQSCTGQNQQGVGTACSENGNTKYTSCQCKAGYNQTCSELGPVNAGDYCLMNGIKYYNSCKTCANKCSLAVCPAGVSCTQEDCSGKYCAMGCAVNYKDLDNYWCNGALRCWFK